MAACRAAHAYPRDRVDHTRRRTELKAGFRLAQGGTEIDRSQRLAFQFDDRRLEGFSGDTLASALLANGVRTVARSFKLHRRRGIRAEGWDDP
ncbi:MAG: (2Fe-2S)-binding protein, partial [Betaproteobacteria bacterium]|nr:(2Fe-2S)-binding protein [Betaproteobacteria bacterium]